MVSKRSNATTYLAKDKYRHILLGAWVHASALRCMQAEPTYKPFNVRISDASELVRTRVIWCESVSSKATTRSSLHSGYVQEKIMMASRSLLATLLGFNLITLCLNFLQILLVPQVLFCVIILHFEQAQTSRPLRSSLDTSKVICYLINT